MINYAEVNTFSCIIRRHYCLIPAGLMEFGTVEILDGTFSNPAPLANCGEGNTVRKLLTFMSAARARTTDLKTLGQGRRTLLGWE